MKSLLAVLAPTVAAVIEALGLYQYLLIKPMAVSGMVFFPILFTLMVLYILWRRSAARKEAASGGATGAGAAPETPYALMHTILMVLGVLVLVVAIIGQAAHQPRLYPSIWWYYGALLLVVLETAFCIAGLPAKEKPEKPQRARKQKASSRRRQPAGAGPTHLVAKSKNSAATDSSKDA